MEVYETIDGIDCADSIAEGVFSISDSTDIRDVMKRRLRRFEILLAIGLLGAAQTQLNFAESAFCALWKLRREQGRIIESELSVLPEIAAAWVGLSRLG